MSRVVPRPEVDQYACVDLFYGSLKFGKGVGEYRGVDMEGTVASVLFTFYPRP